MQIGADGVITFHHHADEPLRVANIIENRFITTPYERKPLARQDEIRAHKNTGDKAVELAQQHRIRITIQPHQGAIEAF